MRALTILPGRTGTLQLDQVDEPSSEQGGVLVRTLAVGICGTDRELIEGKFGAAPAGQERLVLGHEYEAAAQVLARADRDRGRKGDVKTLVLFED